MSSIRLSKRNAGVLKAVVNTFIETGEPVGSKKLSKDSDINYSPATLRNIMSTLSEEGFLSKTHFSSGSSPTDLGYRTFVDHFIGFKEPTLEEKSSIKDRYLSRELHLEQLSIEISQILSELTNNAGFFLLPNEKQLHFQHIQFIKISRNKAMVVIVSKSGMIQNKMIKLDNQTNQEELDKITNYLNDEFTGLTLNEIKEKVIEQMNQEGKDFDFLYKKAFSLSSQIFSGEQQEDSTSSLYMEGTSKIFSQPDFADDFEKLQELYNAFEEKNNIVSLLNKCIDDSTTTVLIGSECTIGETQECSLVARHYLLGGRTLGTVGVIGPKRMRYDRVVSLVNWTANSLTDYLTSEKTH